MLATLLIGNDHIVELAGLHDEISGSYLNAATVTARLKTVAGVEVAGESWPITLTYVTGSNGNYRGTIEDAVVLESGKSYMLEITADGGGDLIGFWRKELIAQYRTF